MISYSKKEHDYQITINLKGTFSENEITSIMNTTFNYIGTMDTPVSFLIDCRGLQTNFNDLSKRRIVETINKRTTKNFTHFALIYSEKMMENINPLILNTSNLRSDTKVMIFESIENAKEWLDNTEIPVISVQSSDMQNVKTAEEEIPVESEESSSPRIDITKEKNTDSEKKAEIKSLTAEEAEEYFLTRDEHYYEESGCDFYIYEENDRVATETVSNTYALSTAIITDPYEEYFLAVS